MDYTCYFAYLMKLSMHQVSRSAFDFASVLIHADL